MEKTRQYSAIVSDEMARDDSNYLDALGEIRARSRASIAISSVPLALVLVQLQYLASVNSFWPQFFATAAVLLLFFGTLIASSIAVIIQNTYTAELFRRDGKESQKGHKFLEYAFGLSTNPNAFTEESAIENSRRLLTPFWICTLFGYISLFILVFLLIWSGPANAVTDSVPKNALEQVPGAEE
ncbi:MAG: hypothetical protein ACU0C9_05465 [Paracoccaceae bacterium]